MPPQPDRHNHPAGIVKPGGSSATTGCFGRMIGILFFGAFFLGGLFFSYGVLHESWLALQTRFWKATPCRIVSSGIVPDPGDDSKYRFEVTYSYEAPPETHYSSRARIDGGKTMGRAEALLLAKRYPAGAKAICYVNPSNADAAVLERSSPTLLPFIPIPMIFILIGGVGAIAMFRSPKEPVSISAAAPSPFAIRTGGIWLFGILLFIGLAVGPFLLFKPLFGLIAARGWQEVPCTIESSEVRTHRGGDSNTYSVEILYRYAFGGEVRYCTRYIFMGGSSSGYDSKRAAVLRFPAGSSAVCFVNPKHPDEAVLDRGWHAAYLLGLIPIVLILIGAIGLIRTLDGKPASPRQRAWSGMGGRRRPDEASRSNPYGREAPSAGPVTLSAGSSPLGRLAIVIIIALFWNGIVSVFIYQCIGGWRHGDGSIFMTLFLVPFALIGAGLIVGIFYCFLAIFTPRPTVRIELAAVPLGGRAWVEWRISGNAMRIKNFTLTLEGEEQATYRRGTATHTDRSLFHRAILTETGHFQAIQYGRIDLAIPEHAMHTLDAPNNKISWSLRLHGEIERWPDMNEQYKFVVEPSNNIPQGGS